MGSESIQHFLTDCVLSHAGSKDPTYTSPLQEDNVSSARNEQPTHPGVVHTQEASNSSSNTSQHPSSRSIVQTTKRNLERNFSRVQRGLMKSNGVTAKSLRECVATLTSFQSDKPGPLLKARNKGAFFHELKNYCSILNPEILEDLVVELGDEETKRQLNDFSQENQIFLQIKLSDFIGNFEEEGDFVPSGYQELKLKLGENWRDKTLADLKRMKERMSVKLWILKTIDDGSVTVTYLVPNSETLRLRDYDYCTSQNVLQITIGEEVVFEGECWWNQYNNRVYY